MRNRRAFTLTEVILATAITTLVLASVFTTLIGMFKAVGSSATIQDLSVQGRLLREQLLHGIQGEFGLRHAGRGSILYTTNALQFRDSGSSNRFTIVLQTNQPLRVQNEAGFDVLRAPSYVLLKSSSVTMASNILIMNLVLSSDDGQRVRTQSQEIRTYLLND